MWKFEWIISFHALKLALNKSMRASDDEHGINKLRPETFLNLESCFFGKSLKTSVPILFIYDGEFTVKLLKHVIYDNAHFLVCSICLIL